MDFEKYIDTIAKSKPEDWNRIDGGWLHRFALVDDLASGSLEVERIEQIMAFRPDLSISVSEGLVCSEQFDEQWVSDFSKCYSVYLDFFYGGMLVYRTVAVRVDDGSCLLPLPSPDTKGVPAKYRDVVRVIFGADDQHEKRFDEYVERAGLKIVDDPWP